MAVSYRLFAVTLAIAARRPAKKSGGATSNQRLKADSQQLLL
jgi:hypothetical protein